MAVKRRASLRWAMASTPDRPFYHGWFLELPLTDLGAPCWRWLGVRARRLARRQRLPVTVVNTSGHGLPSGQVEGRRVWLEVKGHAAAGRLAIHLGLHDPASDAPGGSVSV